MTPITSRRAALIAATLFGTLLVAFAAWQLRGIILLFIVSLAIAGMIRAPINFLVTRRVPSGLATSAVVLIGVIVIVAALLGIGPIVLGQVPQLTTDAVGAYEQVRASISGTTLTGQIMARLLPTGAVVLNAINSSFGVSVDKILGATASVIDVFSQCSLVIVLAIYWMSERPSFERLWLSLLSPDQRMRTRTIGRSIEDEVGAYLRSEAAQTLLTGAILYVGFMLLGIKYPLLLATLAALCWLVPLIGAIIALPFIVLIAGLSGPVALLSSCVLTLLTYVLMEFVIEPRLYHRRKFSTIWTVLAALILVDALGMIGLFVAPMVATVVQIGFEEGLKPAPTPTAATPIPDVDALRARLANARATLNGVDQPPPYALGLLSRLEKLMDRAAQEV